MITAEKFTECVGREPENDDLDRCNCPLAGTIRHQDCGWHKSDMPVFLVPFDKR